ncbi:MAG TPA: hypothetical protein VJ001_04660 [Rhodocyclaceae bacterium]|nr:hypothetical protein [Rhodocyclaceae bacterium]
MQSHPFMRFAFRIKTRLGVVVNNLMVTGRDEIDAQRRLRQIYRDCQIMECVCHNGGNCVTSDGL